MKVAFFLLHYPVFSETFVSKELLVLQKLGVSGQIYCEKQNHTPPFHPHIKDIKYPVHEISQKIFGKHLLKILNDHVYWLIHHPIGYTRSALIFLRFLNLHHLRVFIKSASLARNLQINKTELIYVHEVDSPCLYGLICSRLLNIPCGIIIHTQYLLSQNRYLRPKILKANFIIFQSKYSLSQATKIAKLNQKNIDKCQVISTPGIDTNLFNKVVDPKFPRQIRLISVGRFEEAKGYLHLIRAIKILSQKYPNILLTLVGDGSLRPKFETYIINNNLQKNIRLLGYISHGDKLTHLLQQHQYFILPSIVDSQGVHDVHPNVVKEAMSCGLITITSRLGGIDEIITNHQSGFIIEGKISPQKIADTISKIHCLEKQEKISISNNTRITIINHHQEYSICSQLLSIFSTYVSK